MRLTNDFTMKRTYNLKNLKNTLNDKPCAYCGKPLDMNKLDIKMYPHGDGWLIDSKKGRQWLYVNCPSCEFDSSLTKLGVAR